MEQAALTRVDHALQLDLHARAHHEVRVEVERTGQVGAHTARFVIEVVGGPPPHRARTAECDGVVPRRGAGGLGLVRHERRHLDLPAGVVGDAKDRAVVRIVDTKQADRVSIDEAGAEAIHHHAEFAVLVLLGVRERVEQELIKRRTLVLRCVCGRRVCGRLVRSGLSGWARGGAGRGPSAGVRGCVLRVLGILRDGGSGRS
ncbi:MAG: hypothetical protein AAF567_19855 [Actinomycetota bacterium]